MEIPHVNMYDKPSKKDAFVEKEDLQNLVARTLLAKKEARQLIEVEAEDKESAMSVNNFIHGRISLQEFNANDSTQFGILKPGEIELSGLDEMREFLADLLHNKELAQELVEHEREHFDKIMEIGWSAKLLFRFFRDNDGSLSGRPGVVPNIPRTGDENEIRNKLQSIIEAVHDASDMDVLATKK
ncbi:MAG: hypothetical protein Q7T51_04775 [Candidatus Moranbacteria bacterium]|nr:hypothetical protein [Candidatus Moranbacteria bacterium]